MSMKASKKQLFIKSLLYITSIITLLSCGAKRIKTPEDDKPNQIGAILKLESNVEVSNKSAAKRICDALRVNRVSIYEKNLIGSSKSLNIVNKYCSKGRDEFSLQVVLKNDASGDFSYFNSTDKFYFRKIQTHIDGELESICPQILRNENISLILTQGLSKIKQVTFSASGGDHFDIVHATLDVNSVNGDYLVTESTTYKVETVSVSNFGQVISIKRDVSCAEEGKTSYFLQE